MSPRVLGSRSTYLPAALGPLPRPLAPDDALALGPSSAGMEAAGRAIVPPDYTRAVRAVAGPHDARFSDEVVAAFFSASFAVSPQSDRMGVRLEGVSLEAPSVELLSCGIVAGAVQVPPGGTPIVLVADHQPILCEILDEYLTRDCHIVETAADGREAFERFQSDRRTTTVFHGPSYGSSVLPTLGE